ncbi:MAG: AtpZ/AtpI family protein [Myxococcota bacterium]|nr:AtpZ/AtpI family protein [Myxococcota bacterium]
MQVFQEDYTDSDGRKMLRQAGRFAAVGLEMGIAVAIGIFGGRYLDEKFDSAPVFFWIGFVLGVGAAGKAVFDAFRMAKKELTGNGTSSSEKD